MTEIIGDNEKIYFILNDTFFSLSESFFYSSKDANIAIGLFVIGSLFVQVQYVVVIDIKVLHILNATISFMWAVDNLM